MGLSSEILTLWQRIYDCKGEEALYRGGDLENQHAMQVKKDNRKLKAKAFVKKFDEELIRVTILCVRL